MDMDEMAARKHPVSAYPVSAPPRKRRPRRIKKMPAPPVIDSASAGEDEGMVDALGPGGSSDNGTPIITRTKTRAQLSIADKQEICKMHEADPLLSHEEILAQFLVKTHLQIGRSTVTKILKEKEKWLAVDCAGMADEGRRKRARKSPFLGLEAALYAWYCQKQGATKSMTDSQLRDRAKQLARESGIEKFKSSDGWLSNFKKRHSIKFSGNVIHEPQKAAEPQVGMSNATSVLQRIIDELGFHPRDVFNFGETGLYFRAQPFKNAAAVPLRVSRLQMDRITIGFCLNATGDEKLKLVVVHKAKAPSCFAGWNPESLVHYHHNTHARMTNTVFVDWVRKVNREMVSKKRRILILLNNAPSHDIPGHEKVKIHAFQTIQLSSVTLLFFPPRTDSAVQPLDAGCIEAFKMHYRKHLLSRSLDDLENGQRANSSIPSRSHASVKDAIIWAVLAWEEVGLQTIQQSWCKVDICPPALWNVDLNAADQREHVRMQTGVEYELGALIANLQLGDLAISPNQYIMMPGEDQTEASYTDEQLLHMIQSVESGNVNMDDDLLTLTDEMNDPEGKSSPGIPLDDARRMFRGASQFMSANPQMFSSEDLLILQRWCYKVSMAALVDRERQQQSRIMGFFLDE